MSPSRPDSVPIRTTRSWLDAHAHLSDYERQAQHLRRTLEGLERCPQCDVEGLPHEKDCIYWRDDWNV